jgi:hypothetical protein
MLQLAQILVSNDNARRSAQKRRKDQKFTSSTMKRKTALTKKKPSLLCFKRPFYLKSLFPIQPTTKVNYAFTLHQPLGIFTDLQYVSY